MYGAGGGIQGGPMPQGMPGQGGQMYSAMGAAGGPPGGPTGPGQAGMSQYSSYQQGPITGGQMMNQGPGGANVPTGPGGPTGNMMGQGYQPGYQANPAMMGIRQQQPGGYMGQGMTQSQIVQRPQYIQVLWLMQCSLFVLLPVLTDFYMKFRGLAIKW